MIRAKLLSSCLCLFLATFTTSAAFDEYLPPDEPESGAVVCTPGLYRTAPDDCLPLGPSAYLNEQANLGIPYPIRPLFAKAPDPSLRQVPFWYFKVEVTGAPLYSSLDSAIAKTNASRYLDPGFTYIAYVDRVDSGRGIFYLTSSGGWMPGKGSRISYSNFQGLEFRSTPRNAFGWVLGEAQVKRAPGVNAPNSGKFYYRFDIVQIYNTREADGLKWHLIGPDEWIEGRLIGAVFPSITPPEGVNNGRWIDVNLEQQTLAVYFN